MARKSGANTPAIIDGVLYTNDENTTGLRLSDQATWSAWLEDNEAFYFEHKTGGFSARRQKQHYSYYWYAYKRVGGTLHKKYLGMRDSVTLTRLQDIALSWSQVAS